MNYSSFTHNSRFTKYLVESGILKDHPLVIIDVGASGGPEYHWANYGAAVRFIGFEPDTGECEQLNDSAGPNSQFRYYPVALFKDKGSYTFYHQALAASGLYPADQAIVSRFPDEESFRVRRTSTVHTTDFDSFAEDFNIPDVDFMKLDAEGAELDILKESVRQLKKSVIGISCEVLFMPWRGEGKGLGEIEQFLRPLGFKLYDLNLYRYARNAFPGLGSAGPMRSGEAPYGQIGLGQAIFFRDPVSELGNTKSLLSDWDETRILKAASLFEVFRLPDCAIELLDAALKHGILHDSEGTNIERFRDLITSGFLGRTTTYRQYLKKLSDIKERGYVSCFEHLKPLLRKIPYLLKARAFIKRQISYRRNNVVS